MNASQKIEKILETIRSGKTVYVRTTMHNIRLDRRALNRFEKGGHTLLKAIDDSMYMASGSKFVCIDYCQFTVEG